MSGAQIAADIDAALAEVAGEVGTGTYSVTLIEPVNEPSSPWDTDVSTDTRHVVNALVQNYPAALIDGTLIQRNDKKFMIAGTAPDIQTDWRIDDAGTVYNIINIDKTAPSGATLFYEVQGRR